MLGGWQVLLWLVAEHACTFRVGGILGQRGWRLAKRSRAGWCGGRRTCREPQPHEHAGEKQRAAKDQGSEPGIPTGVVGQDHGLGERGADQRRARASRYERMPQRTASLSIDNRTRLEQAAADVNFLRRR